MSEDDEQTWLLPLDEPLEARAESPAKTPPARPVPLATGWSAELTHRLRVLLHTAPLVGIKRADAMRAPELQHYDGLTLAIRIIDLVIEHTGLEREADSAAVERALTPLLAAMDHTAGLDPLPARHALMIDRVLAALRNDGEARRPFEVPYGDFDEDGRFVPRRLAFRLLTDQYHPAGGTVLRLSNEAVNLYLNALELDIEDAQAAAEAVVQSQLARGRFDEAVQSARNAHWMSVRYQAKLEGILRDTRRDVGRVDWRQTVPRLLDEARAHIRTRLDIEEGILDTAETRRDALVDAGAESAVIVARVIELVRDCKLRHTGLHERVMRARNIFLDAQARQAFTPAPPRYVPDLAADVLEPMLRLEARAAGERVERAMPAFFGAARPRVVSLTDLVHWQLRPRRALPRRGVEVQRGELVEALPDLVHYPAEIRAATEAMLAGIDGPTKLSSVLEAGRAAGASEAALELVTLLALQAFAPDREGVAPLRADREAGAILRDPVFFGDDLVLDTPGERAS